MAIIPDLNNAKEQSGSVPQAPEGWHEMTVSAIEEKKNMKGNTTHFVAFACSAGQARANFMVGIGSETNPKALEIGLGRYKGLIAALGITTFAGLDTSHLIGRAVRVLVKHEPWTAQDGTAMTSAEATVFQRSERAQAAVAPPAAKATTMPGVATDDCPF